jgi:[acyl-carrier-protein] S-malonyltransferase
MKALLFPGQGSQIVGMGSEFFNNFDIVKKIFNEADEALKFKLSKIILNGPDDELKLTQNTQPAIMTVSYSIFSVLKKEYNITLDQFKYFAGHSLGEYSALVSGEALNFSDAVYLLQERGKAMQEAVPVGQGAMLAVLGCEIEELNNLITNLKSKKVCEIANDNSVGQTIVSGGVESISELQNELKVNKKKSILLPVSAPFHCSLMKSAAEKMKEKINTTSFKESKIEIVSNVNASPEIKVNMIKKNLIDQICSKVRWRESILFMIKNGVSEFIEIGPGKVLSGLVKRITNESKSKNINSINDMKGIF